MIVIPSIHLRAGRVLLGAHLATRLADEPGECAEQVIATGARRVQVINIDAQRGVDDPRTRRAARQVVNAFRDAGIAVDVGGGVRSRAAAEFWIESGASTAILGTIGVYRPDIAGEICRAFPHRITLGLEVQGEVAHSDGWIRDAGDATIHLRRWAPWPAAGVIRTSLDGSAAHYTGAGLDALRRCIAAYSGPLICNDRPRGLADLAQAAAAGAAALVLSLEDDVAGLDVAEAVRLFPGRDLAAPHA